jgi:hypothetical protein
MLDNGQKQTVGDHSTVVQGGGDVVIHMGLTMADARNIALDVAKATFYELSGQARDTMSERVEEITDKVISKIAAVFPEGLNKAKDPDFQFSLLTVQKEYGRTGDTDLGNLLVDLLVDSSRQIDRSIMQIVLHESLSVAPKLTQQHLSSIALIYLFRHTASQSLTSHENFGSYLDQLVKPFVEQLSKNDAAYQHMSYAGCGSQQLMMIDLNEVFKLNYGGLFQKGVDEQVLNSLAFTTYLRPPLFTKCLSNPNLFQVDALNKDVLGARILEAKLNKNDSDIILDMFATNVMSLEEIKMKVLEIRPYMSKVYDWWDGSPAKGFSLTSVGIAIGHANMKMIGGNFADLSVWVN